MLLGNKDALALTAIGTGLAISSPWLAGSGYSLLGLLAPAFGAGYLATKKGLAWMNKVNEAVRENFVIESDKVFPESMGVGGLRIGYTRDKNLPVDIENQFFQRHNAIIGQSGVGKTVLGEFILWQQMVRGGGFIFIDAKLDASTRDKLAYFARILGNEDKYYVLNVDQPDNSNTYNPLLEGDADEVASRILNLLPSSENNPGSDHYRQSAAYALTVLVGALKASKNRYHFGDLSIMLQSAEAIEAVEKMCPSESKEKATLEIFLNQFRKVQGKTTMLDVNKIKDLLGGMSGRLASFAQGKFGKVFNTYCPEIDLYDIIINNKYLYVMLPTMGKDTAALNLGKMVLSDLRTAVARVQALPEAERIARMPAPFIVFADEMGSYVMPGIARVFEQARSARICMLPAFQSFANLASVSPEFADMIIQNTWNKFFFKFGSENDPETASAIIGTKTKHAYSLSSSESESVGAQNLRVTPQSNQSVSGGIGETWREEEVPRVSPDQLKSLGMGQCIVLSGTRVFHVNTCKIDVPDDIPPFRVTRHPVKVPSSESVLDFEKIYKRFMMKSAQSGVERD